MLSIEKALEKAGSKNHRLTSESLNSIAGSGPGNFANEIVQIQTICPKPDIFQKAISLEPLPVLHFSLAFILDITESNRSYG